MARLEGGEVWLAAESASYGLTWHRFGHPQVDWRRRAPAALRDAGPGRRL